MQDFRNLDVWKKAHELALDVHKTVGRSKKIDVNARGQISRAVNSIAANIVEGCGKASRLELARFADISIGSASELEYWLLLTYDLGQLPEKDHARLSQSAVEVRRMLFGLRRAIKNGKRKAPPTPTPDPVS